MGSDRMNIAYNMDCLAAMREMPDKAFDLAVDTSKQKVYNTIEVIVCD